MISLVSVLKIEGPIRSMHCLEMIKKKTQNVKKAQYMLS